MNEESYRVVLHSIGGHSETEKTQFCREVSDHYGIPLPLMEKIADRCPIVIKKDLPFKKAKLLAFAFKTFGATVSVEKKKRLPPIVLESSTQKSMPLELESSHLRKTVAGTWQVLGKVRNRFHEKLSDVWVLVQLFDEFDDLISFEEISLPVNPLLPNESSPFKVLLEGELSIHKISFSFKNASGFLLPAKDGRMKREWIEVKIAELQKNTLSPPIDLPSESVSSVPISSPPTDTEGEERPLAEEEIEQLSGILPITEEAKSEARDEEERESVEQSFDIDRQEKPEPKKETADFEPPSVEAEASKIEEPAIEEDKVDQAEEELQLDEPIDDSLSEQSGHGNLDFIQSEDIDPSSVTASQVYEKEDEKAFSFAWMDEFRRAIQTYEQTRSDPFRSWFEMIQKEGRFLNVYHSLLTLLIYARFNQTHPSDRALENTKRVFDVALQTNLPSEDVPSLDGVLFFPAEIWRDLFLRAHSKLQEVSHRILERTEWKLFDLDRLIRIIPHMTARNSRWAIRFMHQFIPEVRVDLSTMEIEVNESLYRVASRLGVINPLFDYYQGKNSMADVKIQSFARSAFPEDPGRIEDPLNLIGAENQNGPCAPTEPSCQDCPFGSFCWKLSIGFNPPEKGMVFRP